MNYLLVYLGVQWIVNAACKVQVPFDFDKECKRALCEELKDGLSVRFVALQTLIRMKEEAGRPKDLDDLESLRWLAAEADNES